MSALGAGDHQEAWEALATAFAKPTPPEHDWTWDAERYQLDLALAWRPPGVLADLTRRIARAGVDLDLVYVATRNRVVFGSPDLHALRAALDGVSSVA